MPPIQNKKIAVWNHLSQDLLNRLARQYHLSIEWIRFNNGVDLFLSRAVDLCLVSSYNEYLQLAEFGMQIEPKCTFRLSDYGYNLPEDGVYVTEEYYQTHKDVIYKFVKASIRGWMWANQHREETVNIVMDAVRRDNVGTNRYHQRVMLDEVLRLQCEKGNSRRTYKLSREGFREAVKILFPDKLKSLSYEDFVK